MTRDETLRERLERALAPEHLELTDEGGAHVGHPGAESGAGHYCVTVVSARFVGANPVARHRLVYDAVGDLIPDEVHALAITAYTPDEWRARERRQN